MERLRQISLLAFLLLLVAYALTAYLLWQQFQAQNGVTAGLATTGPLWLALQKQPLEDPEALKRQLAEAQERLAKQQARFPSDTESAAVLDKFLAVAKEHNLLILRLDTQPLAQQKTAGGTYQVARYSIQARGDMTRLPAFFRAAAQRTGPVPLAFDNLTITSAPGGDDLRFDLVVYTLLKP